MKQENLFDLGPDWTGFDKDVREIMGDAALQSADQTEAFRVAGVAPGRVVFPKSVAQVSALIRAIRRRSLCLVPLGLCAHAASAGATDRAFVAMSLRRLAQAIDFQPSNMTLTIQAGATLAELQAIAANAGQWLPLDPPFEAKTTVGGLIAANLSGPLRFSQGTVRDLLIGLKVVTADGTLVKGGGRVVKNVAGYDIPKLFCGSEGTLGIIVEATFKLRPLPETLRLLRLSCDRVAKTQEAFRILMRAGFEPSLLELMSFVPLGDFGYNLIVGFSGSHEQVSWQLEQARAALGGTGSVEEIPGGETDSAIRELRSFRISGKSLARLKANLLPTKVLPFVHRLEGEGSKSLLRLAVQAHAGNGIVHVQIRAGRGGSEALERAVERLRKGAEELGGSLVLMESPPDLRTRLGLWGAEPSGLGLMRKLKEALDPGNILSPGRFFP